MASARITTFTAVALLTMAAGLVGCGTFRDTELRSVDRPSSLLSETLGQAGRLPAGPGAVPWDAPRGGSGQRIDYGGTSDGAAPKRRSRIFSGQGVARSFKGAGSQARESRGDVTLDFADTDVKEAASLILGDILQRSYSVSPAVKGRLTFKTTQPIAKEAVLGVFDTVLGGVDATLVDRGSIVEILPIAQAKGVSAPLSGPGKGRPGYRVEVVPLRFVSAVEIRKILEPIGGAGSVLSVDEARNVILLSGSTRTIEPLKEAIALFDQNWAAKSSLGLVPLENVAAETAVSEMRKIFGAGGKPGLAVRYVPIERMNAVVLIAPDVKLVKELVAWLEELDRGDLGGGDRIYVYFAQNTKAVDLAASMQAVLTGRSSSGASSSGFSDAPAPVSLRSGSSSESASSGRRSSSALVVAGGGSGFGGLDPQKVQIVAEEQRNALLVSASPGDWRKVQTILRRLDVPPMQVMLEATVVEVTLNDTLRYGLQWFFNSGNNEFTLSDLGSGAVAAAFPGFSYVFNTSDARVALDALSEVTDVEIVSAPSLMVLNNQTATLQVGDQVPIAVQQAQSVTDPNAPIVNTIQFRDTGVILKVTPRVNNSGLVIAEIDQEVSTVSATESSGIDSPTISQRRLSSTIAVGDGESIALGGLIQDRRNIGRSGVPGLSDIPVLGSLFRSTSNQSNRTELMLIITPRVVRDASEARAVTRELRNRLTTQGAR